MLQKLFNYFLFHPQKALLLFFSYLRTVRANPNNRYLIVELVLLVLFLLTTMITLYDLQKDAIDDLKDRLESEEISEISDLIHEIADGRVPIYYRQIIEVTTSDITLATFEPEI